MIRPVRMRRTATRAKARTASQVDVLGFGCVAVDDLCYIASYPPVDSKAPVLRQERCFGGLVGNALVTAARLGARCAYEGALGRDELSAFALGVMRREGIDLSRVDYQAKAGPVHSHIIVGNDRGTRNIFFDYSRLLSPRRAALAEAVAAARVLLIDHCDPARKLAAVRVARKKNIPVVADFEVENEPQFPELLASVDHLILSRDFAARLGLGASPEEIVPALWNPGRKAVVVTCGAEGSWYLTAAHDGAPRQFPAFAVKTVDTTGCGDVFHGAYAAGLARGLAVEDCLRLAAAAAALKASRPAGSDSIPRRKEVDNFLRERAQKKSRPVILKS